MNSASWIALILAALFIGCGAGMVAHEVMESEAVAQTPWTGQKWEYRLHTRSNSFHKDIPVLIELGNEGWELVDYGDGGFFLKRPLP